MTRLFRLPPLFTPEQLDAMAAANRAVFAEAERLTRATWRRR